jgi:hypothetical protein
VGVPVGGVSVVASAGWAAPEQIRLLPVAAATDVYAIARIAHSNTETPHPRSLSLRHVTRRCAPRYPLAQMVVAALGAQIYGEEKTFVVPFKGGS